MSDGFLELETLLREVLRNETLDIQLCFSGMRMSLELHYLHKHHAHVRGRGYYSQ